VLFSLDQASLNAVLEQSQAELSSARANLRVERAEAAVAIEEWELVYADEPVPSLVAREPQISQALAAVHGSVSRKFFIALQWSHCFNHDRGRSEPDCRSVLWERI